MIIYSYDRTTFEYIGTATAPINPVTHTVETPTYLMPAWAAETQPPAVNTDEIAVYDPAAEAWSVVSDFRGQVAHDAVVRNEITIDELGNLPAGYVIGELPALPADLATQKLAAINAEYGNGMAPISSQYPAAEIDGWPRQITEAEKFRVMEAADPANPPTVADTANFPVLANIAESRAETLLSLVLKVEAKVAGYDTFYGLMTGKRQALEDALMAIDTNDANAVTDIAAIDENELMVLSNYLVSLGA
jgi:hypothetical protein